MARKKDVQVGMQVTCKQAEESYYSDYAGSPTCFFEPGDVGTVAAVEVPYVTGRDRTFVCVDFYKEGIVYNAAHGGSPWRVGLDYSNIRIVSNGSSIPQELD